MDNQTNTESVQSKIFEMLGKRKSLELQIKLTRENKSFSDLNISEDLLNPIYDRFRSLEKKNRKLKKENERFDKMKLCTKKNSCKHARFIMDNVILEPTSVLAQSDAINRLIKAHFIYESQISKNKFYITNDMTIFILGKTNPKSKADYIRTIGMSIRNMNNRQVYLVNTFIPKICSAAEVICNDIMGQIKPDDVTNLLKEYLQIISSAVLSDGELEDIARSIYVLYLSTK